MEPNFKITQLIRHNRWNQHFLIIFPYYEIKYIKFRIILPKERLVQYFFTFASSFKHPQDKNLTALLGTPTRLNNYYSVGKSPPLIPFLFLYICKWWCLIQSPPPATTTQLPSRDINRICYSCFSIKKRRQEEGSAIFRNENYLDQISGSLVNVYTLKCITLCF